MKLTNDYIGIFFKNDEVLRKNFMSALMNPKLLELYTPDDIKKREQTITKFINPDKNEKMFYISQKVQEQVNLLKFEKIDLQWFYNIASQNSTYILNKNQFFKFFITEEKFIHYMFFEKKDDTYNFHLFVLGFIKGESYFPYNSSDENYIYLQKYFIKLLLFIELTEKKTIIVPINTKKNLPNYNIESKKVYNNSSCDVIIVDTNWNKKIIRIGEITVSGHYRCQPYGKENKLFKIIWIDEYIKNRQKNN